MVRIVWLVVMAIGVGLVGAASAQLWVGWPGSEIEGVLAARRSTAGSSERRPSRVQDPVRDPGTRTQSEDDRVESGRRFLDLQDDWESRLTAKANRALGIDLRRHVVITVNLELDPRTESSTSIHPPSLVVAPNVIENSGRGRLHDRALPSDPNRAPAATGLVPSRLRQKSFPVVRQVRRDSTGEGAELRGTDPSLYGRKTERPLAPTIKRITASVVIHGSGLAGFEDPSAAKDSIVDIVKHAIGFDADRGDRFSAPAWNYKRSTVSQSAIPSPQRPRTTHAESESDGLLDVSADGSPFSPGADLTANILIWATIIGAAGLVCFMFVLVRRSTSRVRSTGPDTGDSPEPDATETAAFDVSSDRMAQQMCHQIEMAIEEDEAGVSRLLGDWAMESRA